MAEPYTPKHFPLTYDDRGKGEFFTKDGVELFQPAGWAVDPVLATRVVREADVPFSGAMPEDILPPDLDKSEGRDLGWLCFSCHHPLVARVITVVLLGGQHMMEWNHADRWRLVCTNGCKGDNSSGTIRLYWSVLARRVARGEKQRRELPSEYRSTFEQYVEREQRQL